MLHKGHSFLVQPAPCCLFNWVVCSLSMILVHKFLQRVVLVITHLSQVRWRKMPTVPVKWGKWCFYTTSKAPMWFSKKPANTSRFEPFKVKAVVRYFVTWCDSFVAAEMMLLDQLRSGLANTRNEPPGSSLWYFIFLLKNIKHFYRT
jgi:Ni,Fe-hydrogenase I cytochrome b subunit